MSQDNADQIYPTIVIDKRILIAIQDELESANDKFPMWPNDPAKAYLILAEEVGELSKAILEASVQGGFDKTEEVYTEAVQVAAMSIMFISGLRHYYYELGGMHEKDYKDQP